jgi:DivIVA domain-containing protein
MTQPDTTNGGAGPRTLAPPLPKPNPKGADAVREADFPVVLRGYDRTAVDEFLDEIADLIDVLEARQAREAVVQRALDEVGEETSAILKQAHESADEVAGRSRAQAEERLERARDEADAITADARERAAQLERDTSDLWERRAELLDDLRTLGGEARALADGAAERLAPPVSEEPETETAVIEPPD